MAPLLGSETEKFAHTLFKLSTTLVFAASSDLSHLEGNNAAENTERKDVATCRSLHEIDTNL